MTVTQIPRLLVAGVAGGVGTSTWVRILRWATRIPVVDLREYRGGDVHVLVTSNTAAAAARLGPALNACPRPPLLVVMHTVPGVIAESRAVLRKVEPHVAATFDIGHQWTWLEMPSAPGTRYPGNVKDVTKAISRFPAALQEMFAAQAQQPPRTPAPGLRAVPARAHPARLVAGSAPPQPWSPAAAPPHPIHRGIQGNRP